MSAQRAHFGLGCLQEADALLEEFSAKRILLVRGGRSYALSGAKDGLNSALSKRHVAEFTLETALPELSEALRGVALFKQGNYDVVIGVGGGAPMDIAKLIAFFAAQSDDVQSLMQKPPS